MWYNNKVIENFNKIFIKFKEKGTLNYDEKKNYVGSSDRFLAFMGTVIDPPVAIPLRTDFTTPPIKRQSVCSPCWNRS